MREVARVARLTVGAFLVPQQCLTAVWISTTPLDLSTGPRSDLPTYPSITLLVVAVVMSPATLTLYGVRRALFSVLVWGRAIRRHHPGRSIRRAALVVEGPAPLDE